MGERESGAGEDRGWIALAVGAAVVALGLAVLVGVVARRFVTLVYLDLGIRVPQLTDWALKPWVHVAVMLMLVCAAASIPVVRSTAPFAALAFAYAVVALGGLFLPLAEILHSGTIHAGR